MKLAMRKVAVAMGALVVVGLMISNNSIANPIRLGFNTDFTQLKLRRSNITAAFQHAWDGYASHCFGHDSIRPVSNECEDEFGGWGVTAIDSLSTAIIMGNEAVTIQILEFIATLDMTKVAGGSKLQLFEVAIRHFGGMISAWDLLDGPFSWMVKQPRLLSALYDKMIALGDALSCAFDTPSGVPHDWVDPASCTTDDGSTIAVAGAGTLILEFGRLSDITGNETYARLARKAESYLLSPKRGEAFPGLLGSHVSVQDGEVLDSTGSWGAFADSFYEYLIKGYMYNSDLYGEYLERWLLAADSTIRFVGSHPYGHPDWTLLASWSGTALTRRMETLSWFAGGNIVLGGMVTDNQTLIDYGLSIADAAGAVYNMTRTGLGGEFVTWSPECSNSDCNENSSIQLDDGRYQLRPEVLETWYYAYRATHDKKYLEWSWAAFEAINRYCRTDSGFSAINDVNAADGGGKADKQESFVFAEVFKYLYLVHLDGEHHPFHVQDSRTGKRNSWVFNTEAHPLRVAGPPV